MSDSKAYCVGWLFTTDDTGVLNCKRHGIVLVNKSRPAWQYGKLNGLGGALLPGEFPIDAMEREGREELGELLPPGGIPWIAVGCTRFWNGVSVYSYAARLVLPAGHPLTRVGAEAIPTGDGTETLVVLPYLDASWLWREDMLYDVRMQVEMAKMALNMTGGFLYPVVDSSDVGRLVFSTSALPPEMRSVYSQRAPKDGE